MEAAGPSPLRPSHSLRDSGVPSEPASPPLATALSPGASQVPGAKRLSENVSVGDSPPLRDRKAQSSPSDAEIHRHGAILADIRNWGGRADVALQALRERAQAGQTLAVDALLRAVHTQPGVLMTEERSAAVRKSLVALYAAPETEPAIKKRITHYCTVNLQHLKDRQPTGSKAEQNAQAALTRAQAQPLLALAIACHRHDGPAERGAGAAWTELGKQLDPVVQFDPSARPEDMLHPTRYLRQEEVQLAMGGLREVPLAGFGVVGPHSIDMGRLKDLPVIGLRTDLQCFASARAGTEDKKAAGTGGSQRPPSALQAAVERQGPVLMMINRDNVHWTPLVVFPPTASQAKGTQVVPCLLFDSMRSTMHSKRIELALQSALSQPESVGGGRLQLAFEVHGGDFQAHAKNACGPFSIAIGQAIDESCGRSGTPDDARKILEGIGDSWRALSPAAQAESLIPQRAQALAALMAPGT